MRFSLSSGGKVEDQYEEMNFVFMNVCYVLAPINKILINLFIFTINSQ